MRSSIASPSPRLATYIFALALLLCLQIACSMATPVGLLEARDVEEPEALQKRTHFPDYPPSCQICEPHFSEINACANASVIFADVQSILVSPLSFLGEITCACSSTFQYYFPQCVDCFELTNQTVYIEPSNGNMSSIVQGVHDICALGSVIFGGVASVNSQLPGQTPITVASGAAFKRTAVSLLGVTGQGMVPLLFGIVTIIMGFGMGVWSVL
jgi:hypothetical protein